MITKIFQLLIVLGLIYESSIMRTYTYADVENWIQVDHTLSSPIVYVGIVMAVITIVVILREMNK